MDVEMMQSFRQRRQLGQSGWTVQKLNKTVPVTKSAYRTDPTVKNVLHSASGGLSCLTVTSVRANNNG